MERRGPAPRGWSLEAEELAGHRALHDAVTFLDLDGFKQINDTHGHEAGDPAKLVRRLVEPMVFEETRLTVGVRIGLALYPDEATTAAGLLTCADAAMYVARKERRDGVGFGG